jgi:parvulin-like peptidyl-prolyl isomerase
MKKAVSLAVTWIACVALAQCTMPRAEAEEKPTPEELKRRAQVVATVDSVEITVGDVEDKIRTSIQPAKYQEKEEMLKLIDSLVDQALMENEAKRRKLDELPNVESGVKRVLYNLMQTKYIEENLSLDSISKAEVKKYYDEHEGDYNQPSLVRASHILVADEAKAKGFLEQAGAKSFDLRMFRQLATENSEDEVTKKRGGDLRYFSTDGKVWYSNETVPKEVAEAAFSVNVKVRALVIVFDDGESAGGVLKELMSTKSDEARFKAAVKKHSVDETTKKKGGDTGLFNIDGKDDGGEPLVPESVAATAFSFQTPGTIVPRVVEAGGKHYVIRIVDREDPGSLYPDVVKSSQGFHVVWVVNRRPALHKSIDEVEYSIKQRLWQEKKKQTIDDLVESLKKKYNARIYEENLDKVVIDLSGLPSSVGKGAPPAP